MLYFSHPSSLEHDPSADVPGHPDTPARLIALERGLGERGWLGWERREAPAAAEDEIALIHSAEHIEAMRDLSAAGGGAVDPDTHVGTATYRAALHAAGGACAMTRALLAGGSRVGFSALRPSGHHAEAGRAMGFCIFDNVAIAAALAIAELGAERVFIFDWDVHHGNGTGEAFRFRSDVLFVSIHQAGIYPGTGPSTDFGSGEGEGYTINLPVPAGAGEETWLPLVEQIVLPVATSFGPDLILISAGFDAHRADPLAGCRLETSSFAAIAGRVRDLAARLDAPLGLVLEGGYEPVALTESVIATLDALRGGAATGPPAPATELTSRAAAGVARHWRL
jgi:acetoin utilization deacetylase AcuC-like enzyme